MNEYIVWDEKRKEFVTDYERFLIDVDGDLNYNDEDGYETVLRFAKDCTAFNYIGKTDIEGNKIYADSSIVEFYFSLSHVEQKSKGFVKFNDEDLCYEVLVEDNYDGYDKYNFIDFEFRNLKVIGTVQEDKELLDGK